MISRPVDLEAVKICTADLVSAGTSGDNLAIAAPITTACSALTSPVAHARRVRSVRSDKQRACQQAGGGTSRHPIRRHQMRPRRRRPARPPQITVIDLPSGQGAWVAALSRRTCSERVSTATNARAGIDLSSSNRPDGQRVSALPWKNHGEPLSASTRP